MSILGISEQQKGWSSNGEGKNKRKKLITLPEHTYKVIFPDDSFVTPVYVHYIRQKGSGAYVLCREDDCSICRRNHELMAEFPEDYQEKWEYSRRTTRYAFLVYDMTEYLYCPNCGYENHIDEKKCYSCQSPLNVESEPANAYKTLVLSRTNANQLSTSIKTFITEMEISFGDFYTKIVVNKPTQGKRGLDMTFTHFPLKESVELPEIEFDRKVLESYAALDLSEEEITRFYAGESIGDILRSRSLKQFEDENKDEEVAPEEVKQTVESLFQE